MTRSDRNKVFLLGGADLEMRTIKELLMNTTHIVVDKGLKWNNATLGSYVEELESYSSESYDIYGVELQEDVIPCPDNYIRLDHHNELQKFPSALEQVADIIGHELSFHEKLIAANDKGFYPAMEDLLDKHYPQMSEHEKMNVMQEIRRKDREAQGVCKKDEDYAEHIYRDKKFERIGFFIFVEVQADVAFSPIVDRFWPYDRLVVYNLAVSNTELCYYGKDAAKVLDLVVGKFKDVSNGTMQFYSGGGENGYWGIKKNLLDSKFVGEIVNYIKSLNMVESCHLFYYPFIWNNDIPLDKVENTGGWKRVKDAMDDIEEYDEKNYFYKYVHEKLYDGMPRSQEENEQQDESQVYHYIREIGNNARYIIETKGAIYDLKVVSVQMKLYTTGVGLIVYSLENDAEQRLSPDDILKINQYGRRVFPPFYADIDGREEIAKSITVVGVTSNDIREDFNGYKSNPECWKAGKIIDNLIKDFSLSIKYQSIIDDRMFVMSWYKNNQLISNAVADYSNDNHFWYRYLYVDKNDPMCQDKEMRENLIKEHTYRRWADWNTLYGITRYSMVMLTSNDVPGHLLTTFISIYSRMVELVLMQRASVLKFSDEVNDINKISPKTNRIDLYERTAELYRSYIKFKNQFYFKEVTAQEQGIELYDMLQRSFRLEIMVKDLDEDIQELYQYNSIIEERESNKSAATLNMILGIFTPAAFVVSIISYNQSLSWCGHVDRFILMVISVLLGVILLPGLTWLYRLCHRVFSKSKK